MKPANNRIQDVLLYCKRGYGIRDDIRDLAVIIGAHNLMDPDSLRPVDLAMVVLNDTLHLVLGATPVEKAKALLLQLGRHEESCFARREPHYYCSLVRHLVAEVAVLRVVDEEGRVLIPMAKPDPQIQARLDACERRLRLARVG